MRLKVKKQILIWLALAALLAVCPVFVLLLQCDHLWLISADGRPLPLRRPDPFRAFLSDSCLSPA